MSRLRKDFDNALQQAGTRYPYLHHRVKDSAAAGRLRCLLGLKPYEGQQQRIPKSLLPGGQSAWQWRQKIHAVLERHLLRIKAEFVCGSGANFIAGRRLLVRGLSLLASQQIVRPGETYQELERRIQRLSYRYGDLDMNLELEQELPYHLRSALEQLACPEQVSVKVKGPPHFLIVSIEDRQTGAALDFSIYKQGSRESPYLTQRDSLRVRIDADPGRESILVYDCPDIWAYWRGQVLREAARAPEIKTDQYVLPKIIDLMTRKSCVTPAGLEDSCFERWWTWLQAKGDVNKFYQRIHDLLNEHATSTLGRQCYLLQWAQVLQEQQPKHASNPSCTRIKVGKLFVQLMRPELVHPELVTSDQGLPFLHECMRLLRRGGLALLELTALIALQEGWKQPFSARLEQHNGQCRLRLRFRQDGQKRSLLLRYAPEQSLAELKTLADQDKLNEQELRCAMHLLWLRPITVRECGVGYARELGLKQQLSMQIRGHLLGLHEEGLLRSLTLSQTQSLASLLFHELRGWKALSELGEQLLAERAGTESERPELCWGIVDKLIDDKAYSIATDFAEKLRRKGWERREGYVDLLKLLVTKHPKVTRELLAALSPRGIELPKDPITGRRLVQAADRPKVSASDYWTLVQAFEESPSKLSADMLARLHEVMPLRTWVNWVLSFWKTDLQHTQLCQIVTQSILRCLDDEVALIFPSAHPVFREFIHDRKRFNAGDAQCVLLFERLLARGLSFQKQEALLRAWQLKEPRLWQRLVQAHLLRGSKQLAQELEELGGQDKVEWAAWNQLLSLSDYKESERLLAGVLKGKEPPGGSDAFVAGLLSRWSTRKPQATVLQHLAPDVDWLSLSMTQRDVEHLTQRLFKLSKGLLACFLLKQVKPDTEKCEYVYRALRECLVATPDLLAHPVVLDCVRLYPTFVWKDGLAKCSAQQIWLYITDLGVEAKQLNVKQLCLILTAALAADPSGRRAMAIERQLSKGNYKNQDYRDLRCKLALLQLGDPQGDLHYALEVYGQQGGERLVTKLPAEARLMQLMKLGGSEWVVELLVSADTTARAGLSEELYCQLVERRLRGQAQLRARVLTHPPERAQYLCEHWRRSCRDQQLSCHERGQLLLQQARFGPSSEQLTQLFSHYLEDVRSRRAPCDTDLATLITKHLQQIPRADALALWNALKQTQRPPVTLLFSSLLTMMARYELPDSMLEWLLKYMNSSRAQAFMHAIAEGELLLSQQQLSEQVLPYLVNKQSWELLWTVLSRRPEHPLPAPVPGMPAPPMLDERIERCLDRAQNARALVLAEHLLYHCFTDASYPRARELAACLSRQQWDTPQERLRATLILLGLQPDLSMEQKRALLVDMGCLDTDLISLLSFERQPAYARALKTYAEAAPQTSTIQWLEIYWERSRMETAQFVHADELSQLMRRMRLLLGRLTSRQHSHISGHAAQLPSRLVSGLASLIRRLPKDQRIAPSTDLLKLALVLERDPESYNAIRDLLTEDVGHDNCLGVLAYRYITESLVLLGDDFHLDARDCTWIDYKGSRLFAQRGSLPPGLWRHFAQAVLVHEMRESQRKGVLTSLVRPRLALGLWQGVKLEKKPFDWLRSAKLFIKDVYEKKPEAHDIPRIANWLSEFLQHLEGKGSEKDIAELCRLIRRPWLEGGPAGFIRRHLAIFIDVYLPNIPCFSDGRTTTRRRVILEACQDVLRDYPQLLGELMDVVVERGYYPNPDKKLTQDLKKLCIEGLSCGTHRAAIKRDLRVFLQLDEEAPEQLSDEAALLRALNARSETQDWDEQFARLVDAWALFSKNNTHAYLVQRLVALTINHLRCDKRPDAARVRAVHGHLLTMLRQAKALRTGDLALSNLLYTTVNYCADWCFEAQAACFEELCDAQEYAHLVGLMAPFVLTDEGCSERNLHRIVEIMPRYCRAVTRSKTDGFCGPMGMMDDAAIQNLVNALSCVLETYGHFPEREQDCRRCVDILVELINDTFMWPDLYHKTVAALLESLQHSMQRLCEQDPSGRILNQVLSSLQALLLNETPMYGLEPNLVCRFCVLSAVEGNVERMAGFAYVGGLDFNVYRVLAGKQLEPSSCYKAEKQFMSWLMTVQPRYQSFYRACLKRLEACERVEPHAFQALALGAGQALSLEAQHAQLDILLASSRTEEALTLWSRLRDRGGLEGWNSHWELLLQCSRIQSNALDSLAKRCLYTQRSVHQEQRWLACADQVVPKVISPSIRQALLEDFVECDLAVPSALIPQYCQLIRSDQLWASAPTRCFLGPKWLDYYPPMAEHMLDQVGRLPITALWSGWKKYIYHGGDPDRLGITQRLIPASLGFHMDSYKDAREKVTDWAYRQRRTHVYGNLRWLWSSFEREETIDYWQQLLDDSEHKAQPVTVWNGSTVDDVAFLGFEHKRLSHCVQLLQKTRQRGLVTDAFCGKVLVRLASSPNSPREFLDEILVLAEDPEHVGQADARLQALVKLLDSCLDDFPKAGLVFLAKGLRDHPQPLKHSWVFQRLISLCTRLLDRQYAQDPHEPDIEEALYSVAQVAVLQGEHMLGQCRSIRSCGAVFSSVTQLIKLAYRGRNLPYHCSMREVTYLELSKNKALRIPVPPVLQHTRLLWLCIFGTDGAPRVVKSVFPQRAATASLAQEAWQKLPKQQQRAVFDEMLPWITRLAEHPENSTVVTSLLWTICQLLSLSEKHPRHQKRLADALWQEGCKICGLDPQEAEDLD